MVNVGGGFVTIQEYYDKYSYSQCVHLYRLLKAQNLSFDAGLIQILEQKNKNRQYRHLPEILAVYRE